MARNTARTAKQAHQIVRDLYNALARDEQKKLLALLIRDCCNVQLRADAITPENAENWIFKLLLKVHDAKKLISGSLPLIKTAESIKRKEDNPERNAAIRADRKDGKTLTQIARKHQTTLATVRSVLRRTK